MQFCYIWFKHEDEQIVKLQIHERPTYEALLKGTILEPKYRIALPDRSASILRRTQQLPRQDDAVLKRKKPAEHPPSL